MAQDEKQTGQQVSDSIISEFGTYQEFLDSQITRKDLYYLEVSTDFPVYYQSHSWYVVNTV